ncbi:MAG: hypothetical protein ACTSU5_16390 [Promethearchaeota archaeon]
MGETRSVPEVLGQAGNPGGQNGTKKVEPVTATCPSCGKSIPKKATGCPHCGARVDPRARVSLRKVHLSVLLLGIIGVGLVFYAYQEATRVTPINQVNAGLEGKTVLISGVVIDASYDARYEKTSFTVLDDTGNISFYGWSDFTSELQASGIYPSIGDRIQVEGTVDVYTSSVSGNTITSLEVTGTSAFKVVYVEAVERQIADILLNQLYEKVQIEGQVVAKKGSTNTMLTVQDGSGGQITVFVSEDLINLAGEDVFLPNVSQTVKVIGMVSEYNDQVEIVPSNATGSAIILTGGS